VRAGGHRMRVSDLVRNVWDPVDPAVIQPGSLALMDLRVRCVTCDSPVALDAQCEPGTMSRLQEGTAAGVCSECGEQYRVRVAVERRSY